MGCDSEPWFLQESLQRLREEQITGCGETPSSSRANILGLVQEKLQSSPPESQRSPESLQRLSEQHSVGGEEEPSSSSAEDLGRVQEQLTTNSPLESQLSKELFHPGRETTLVCMGSPASANNESLLMKKRSVCPECQMGSDAGRTITGGGFVLPLYKVQLRDGTLCAAFMLQGPAVNVLSACISGASHVYCKVANNASTVLQDPGAKVVAAGAAGGAVICGAAGGASGAAAGGTLGALVGLTFAPLTLGMSIPVVAAVGSYTGLMMGAVGFGAVGGLGGGLLGFAGYHLQPTVQA